MRTLLLSLFVFISATLVAQAPAIQWQKSFGGTGSDGLGSFALTSDGGYITVGSTNSNDGDVSGNHGDLDGWVVKLDVSGNLQWQKCFGSSKTEAFTSISQTSDGGYILGGITSNGVYRHFYIVKITASGDMQWQKTLGSIAGYDEFQDIKQAADGGYIVAGRTNSNDGNVSGNHGAFDCWIVKLTPAGDIQWQKCFGGSGNDAATNIQLTPDGGYIFTGYTFSTNGDVTNGRGGDLGSGGNGFWLVKLNYAGIMEWQKIVGTESARLSVYQVNLTQDGGYILGGPAIYTSQDFGVIKTDGNGNIQWQKHYGGPYADAFSAMQITPDGNYILMGSTDGNGGDVSGFHGFKDYWVIKIDTIGNLIWQRCLGGAKFEFPGGVQVTADGGYLLSGSSYSVDGDISGHHGNTDNSDAWIVKLYQPGIPYIAVTASPSAAVCTGMTITFTATASASGSFQWIKNHVNVGSNSPVYRDSSLQNGDTVFCTINFGDTVLTSNAIGITVATPSITIVGPSVLCAGNAATYKATAALAGHPVTYQWVKNNVNVGTNSNLYTDNNVNDRDSIWCTIVSDAGCAAGAGLASNKIVVKALAYGTVQATVTYNPNNYKLCAPVDTTSVTFHAVGEYGGANPSFQWVLNNNVVGTDSSFYTANGVKAGDKIYCRYTSSQKCVTGDVHTVVTNTVTLTAKATLTPSITIMQTPDTAVCAGTKVRFKVSSLTGGGENPIYQWLKNNVPVGTNSDTYYDSTLANGDSVWCKMTSHHPCLVGASSVASNKKKVKVDDALPPKPSAISGPASVTASQAGINYSVSTVADVTYLWSIPADASFVTDKHNSSVTVNWGSTAGNVIAQTRNGCGYSDKRVLAVSLAPSLLSAGESSQTVTATGKATLYPNPAKNYATVSFTAMEAGKYMLQVSDANGRILQVKETNAAKGRNTIPINVSGYAKGSYFVRLSNKDGKQQATFTLVVAK